MNQHVLATILVKLLARLYDLVGNRHILSLQVRCDNTSNGCEWTGELRLLDVHLTICGFALLPCPINAERAKKYVSYCVRIWRNIYRRSVQDNSMSVLIVKWLENMRREKQQILKSVPCWGYLAQILGVIQLCHDVALHSIANCSANIKKCHANMLISICNLSVGLGVREWRRR